MAGFNAISLKLKEMYQMITLGGDAELELVDSLDPFSEVTVYSFDCAVMYNDILCCQQADAHQVMGPCETGRHSRPAAVIVG